MLHHTVTVCKSPCLFHQTFAIIPTIWYSFSSVFLTFDGFSISKKIPKNGFSVEFSSQLEASNSWNQDWPQRKSPFPFHSLSWICRRGIFGFWSNDSPENSSGNGTSTVWERQHSRAPAKMAITWPSVRELSAAFCWQKMFLKLLFSAVKAPGKLESRKGTLWRKDCLI